MDDEPKTIQQRIDALLKDLELNGQFSNDLAAELPAVIAAIPDGEALNLVVHTFKTFRIMWATRSSHPEIARLFAALGILLERDLTRRALSSNIETGWLERIGELPSGERP